MSINYLKKFEGKVAIVTASAGVGIGQATLRALAREGASVVVADIDSKGTREVAENLRSSGQRALGVTCDVTKNEQVEEMVKKTLNEFGRIDILVNDCGISAHSLVVDTTDETWDLVMNVNLKGTFYCCRAVLPTMIEQRSGEIVNISSVLGLKRSVDGLVGMGAYAASKAGVMAFTRVLAMEVAEYNIRVNSIAPGFIFHPKHPILRMAGTEERMKKQVSSIPLGRAGKPEEIANAVVFLVSDDASYITGVTLCVSGGREMY